MNSSRESDREQFLEYKFLSNPAFIRIFEVLDTYQRLLKEYEKNPGQRELVQRRMHAIFDELPSRGKKKSAPGQHELDDKGEIRERLYSLCESGALTKEGLAKLFAGSVWGRDLLEEWKPKAGDHPEEGVTTINEVIEYENYGIEDEDVYLSVTPTSAQAQQITSKIVSGLRNIAAEMNAGSLRHVKQVIMESWLLGPRFERKIRKIFGDTVELEDMGRSEDKDERGYVHSIQRMAVSHNKHMLYRYLESGELPAVRRLVVSREDFLRRFLQNISEE